MEHLIEELRRIQIRDAQTDLQIARRLGVSRQTWNFARIGKRRVSLKIIRGMIKGFPELALPAIRELTADSQETHQEPRGGALAGITAAEGRE